MTLNPRLQVRRIDADLVLKPEPDMPWTASLKVKDLKLPQDRRVQQHTSPRVKDYLAKMGHVTAGPIARGHVGVFRDTGRFLDLKGYQRSEWAVLKDTYRQLLARFSLARYSITENIAYVDAGGVSRTLRWGSTGDSGGTMLLENGLASNDQTRLRYGSSAVAPAATQVNVQTQLGNELPASSVVYDDVNFTVDAAAAEVYTGADDTINEVAIFRLWGDTTDIRRICMLDRAAIAPGEAIVTNDVVAVAYDAQF